MHARKRSNHTPLKKYASGNIKCVREDQGRICFLKISGSGKNLLICSLRIGYSEQIGVTLTNLSVDAECVKNWKHFKAIHLGITFTNGV